jgi:peptidoglycan hydrolase CwlO-like protein
MVARTNRTPTFILVGLFIVIFILSYNYWLSIKTNADLEQRLVSMGDKFTDLTNKKSSVDKQNDIFSNRIKFFEERSETNQQAINKKDEEMNEINRKLKESNSEVERLKVLNDESAAKLVC